MNKSSSSKSFSGNNSEFDDKTEMANKFDDCFFFFFLNVCPGLTVLYSNNKKIMQMNSQWIKWIVFFLVR